MATRIISTLRNSRQDMNIHDILTHLDILRNVSDSNSGKHEIKSDLSACLELFRKLLVQYDNSEMNILITNILDNVVPRFTTDNSNVSPEKLLVCYFLNLFCQILKFFKCMFVADWICKSAV